jgi:hypothetical protein
MIQKQLEGKNLKGKELATALRTQARKMLPEYDEGMGLKGKGKQNMELSLAHSMALQTLDSYDVTNHGPCSIQVTLTSLRRGGDSAQEKAQALLRMIEGSTQLNPEFIIRALKAAAMVTMAEAADHEERAQYYLEIANRLNPDVSPDLDGSSRAVLKTAHAGMVASATTLEQVFPKLEIVTSKSDALDLQKVNLIYELAIEFLSVMPSTLTLRDRECGRILLSEQKSAELLASAQEKLGIDEKHAKSLLYALNCACEGNGMVLMWDQFASHLNHASMAVITDERWTLYKDAEHEIPVCTLTKQDFVYEGLRGYIVKPEKEQEFRKRAAQVMLSLDPKKDLLGPLGVLFEVIHETVQEQALKLGFTKEK